MDKILEALNILEKQVNNKQFDRKITTSIDYLTFNGAINGLAKFSKRIDAKNIGSIESRVIDRTLNSIFYQLFHSIHRFPYDFNQLNYSKRQKDKDTSEKAIKTNLALYLSNLEFYGNYSGAFDDLLRRHNELMHTYGLKELSCTQAILTNEFDIQKNYNINLPTILFKSQFWTNKCVKYIDHSLPAMLLFASDSEKFSQLNYNTVTQTTDKDKYIALCKSIFFKILYNEIETNILPLNVCFSDLLIYFDSIQYFEAYDNDPKLKEILKNTPVPPSDALTFISDVSKKYNNIFKNITPKTSFLDDAFASNTLLKTRTFLYASKTELTKAILILLQQDKAKATKRFSNYGIEYDENGNPVLSIERAGYIGRSGVHIPEIMQNDDIKSIIHSLPTHKGFIKTSYIIMPATTEQINFLKREISNISNLNNPDRHEITTHYYAMATGNYFELYKEFNKSKQK